MEQIQSSFTTLHLADVYDALMNVRPYKPAWSAELTREFMQEQRGRMFDPELVDSVLELVNGT